MMSSEYLNKVVRRGNELGVLEQAALALPKKSAPVRWIVAAAFGALLTLIPSACTAQVFLQII